MSILSKRNACYFDGWRSTAAASWGQHNVQRALAANALLGAAVNVQQGLQLRLHQTRQLKLLAKTMWQELFRTTEKH